MPNHDRFECQTAIDSDAILQLTPEHVTHYNSLQVEFAEQYVFCGEKDFSLVERMLADSERYRTGPRFTF
ncbi:hypothetical protein FBG58_20570 [Escherichia coli]|nr:hypothetical protein [Salmonella enterica subsp. enterica serovar Brandenburg]EFC1580862.1 hypothetical protein [Escherichia coli]